VTSSSSQESDAVPHALRTRMDELLSAHAARADPSREPDERQLDAAIAALARLVAREPAEQSALELLAIDGLATGAFVSPKDPARLESLADRACMELMALGNGGA